MTLLSAMLTFLLPGAIVASALLAMTIRPGRGGATRMEEPRRVPGLLRRLIPGVVFVLAFWPADIALNQWHELWPTDGTRRYLAAAVGAGVCACIHAASGRRVVAALLRAGLGAAVAWGVLAPLPDQYAPLPLLVWLAAVTGLWLAAAGEALDLAGGRLPRGAVCAALTLAAAGMAPGLFESGYAGGAQLAGTLGAMMAGAAAALLLLARSTPDLRGANTVWLALLAALLLVTYGYQDVPAWWSLPIAAAAPLGALAGLPMKRRWLRFAAPVLAAGLIGSGATLAVFGATAQDSDEPYYGS